MYYSYIEELLRRDSCETRTVMLEEEEEDDAAAAADDDDDSRNKEIPLVSSCSVTNILYAIK